jgi:hypothetical protein
VPEIVVEGLEMIDVDQQALSGSPFSIAAIWTARKNSSSARRFGRSVSVSVLARSSDLLSESRIVPNGQTENVYTGHAAGT